MAARISRLAPPAAQSTPDQETREQGLRVLRLELEAQSDAGLAALLQHEVARLHERRDDLAASARDELAATKNAAGFVEPIESLIDIATRSRSKANLAKLLERLTKLAQSDDERLRASLALAHTHLSCDDPGAAHAALNAALDDAPNETALWVALESVAAKTADSNTLLRAAMGRAAHATSEEMRCLLLERVARLHVEAQSHEEAFAALRQSVDELPTWRALHAWEELGLRALNYAEAGRAAVQTSTILRAGLEEPDEARLYQIPDEELSEERAIAAHVRGIIFAVRAGEDEDARGLAEQLCEASPQSAFALSLLAELCRKVGDADGAYLALTRLMNARKWNLAELAVLQGMSAQAARSAGKVDDAERLVAGLAQTAPQSLLPRVQKWVHAEASDSPEALFELFLSWGRESGAPWEGDEPAAFLCAAALVRLLSGGADEALSLLETEQATHDPVSLLLKYVLTRLSPSANRHLLLPPELGTQKDQLTLTWESIRANLSSALDGGDESRATLGLATERLHDCWAELSLMLLSEEIAPSLPQKDPLLSLVERCINAEEGSATLGQALEVMLLAGLGDVERLKQRWQTHPDDPLLTGALLATLQTSRRATQDAELTQDKGPQAEGTGSLSKALDKAAEHADDPNLRAAWLLKSAALLLASGQVDAAHEAIESSGALALDSGSKTEFNIAPWFEALRGPTDPQAELSHLLELEDADRDLDRATLLRRWAPEQWGATGASQPSPALHMLTLLHTATDSIEALDYALDDTDLFGEPMRAALPLAKRFSLDDSAALLESSERWVRTCPSPASRLTRWIAATRAWDIAVQAQMIEGLSVDLDTSALLVAVPASDLKKAARTSHEALLKQAHESASTDNKKSLSWAIAELLPDEISEDHARQRRQLSSDIDDSLEDPDAQAALLLAGYEYLTLGNHAEAIAVFERLLKVMPGDLTLCQGARIAAAHTNRPDIEAPVSCELARATEDNKKSARLWERAGVLFQDVLNEPEEAEKCFTAALTRSPGSRLSFERIYRFARDRNDRQHQVELIDARLDSADSESLLIDLYWEKARFCRMLGRRTIALRCLDELLKIAPDHLSALALTAELHLVDGRIDAAAEALKAVAKHPDTPATERGLSGLHACDLFEQLKRPRDAVELLQFLDDHGVSGSAGLERRARSLARSSDWGEAYKAFAELNKTQDDIDSRLESARMMLAIQRDHLKDPGELMRAARSVLRDAPLDLDAVSLVQNQHFPPEERRRLLAPARAESQADLRKSPLNPPEIERFAALCSDCGEGHLERIALGNLGLTGRLSEKYTERLAELQASCLAMPTAPLSRADLEAISDPLQLGAAGKYVRLLAPYLAQELDPTLDALGLSSLMRTDEFSGSPHRAEIGTWFGCFGLNDFELYVGGADPHLIRGVHGDLPTIVVGSEVPAPLSPLDRARVVAQISALHYDSVTYLNHPPELLERWLTASGILAGADPPSDADGEMDEMVRSLANSVPREVREELSRLREEIARTGLELYKTPYVVMRGAARAACVVHGQAMILRELPELIPADPDQLNSAMADLIRFVLSPQFITIRRKIGLEGA